jgi:iron complex outermembrane receptor protein
MAGITSAFAGHRFGIGLLLGFVFTTAAIPALAVDADSGGDNQLAEIIVTANKRAESTLDVPSTVSALSGAELEQLNAASFQDFAAFVPGLTSSSSGIGENQLVLRGISTGGATSSSVAVYLDETPIGSSTSFVYGENALDSSLVDLQRLEVLSGPQGTLYGATSLGGVVKYITRAPDLTSYEAILDGNLSHTQNSNGANYAESAIFNIPLIKDVLALRVDGFAQNQAGYVDNTARHIEGVDAADVRGGRVALLDQFTPDLSLRVTAMTQRIDRDGKSEVDRDAFTEQPVQGLYDQATLAPEPYSQNFNLYSGLFTWNLGWADLTSNSAWQRIQSRDTIDASQSFGPLLGQPPTVPFTTYQSGTTKKYTQEVRLTSSAAKWLDWQFGVYYTIEHAEGDTIASDLDGVDGTFDGLPMYNGAYIVRYQEYAAFGDITVHLTKQFDVTLGLRDSEDDQKYTETSNGLFVLPTAPFESLSKTVSSTENVRTYLFNPRYHLTDDEMLYMRFSTGYRPGGPNQQAYDAEGHPVGSPTFKPDSVYTYEAGLKSAFLQRRASLDFDVYYISWRDIQLVGDINGLAVVENGGTAGVLGSEMTGSYQIGGLTLGGSASYIDATLKDDAPDLGAKAGQRLPLSARWSASLIADYQHPIVDELSGTVGISDRFVGQRNAGFNGSDVSPQYNLPCYNLFDLHAGVTTPHYIVSLYAKNVFNRLGFLSGGVAAADPALPARITLTEPRTIGLEIKARFKE